MSGKLFSKHSCRTVIVWSASFLFGSCLGVTNAQQNPPPEQAQNPNPDVTQREVASFDAFLDNHPAIDKDLRSNPSLISDKTWVQNHPDLQTYLSNHPRVRDEIMENPSYFIRRENRYERSDRDQDLDRNRDRDRQGQNSDVTHGEVSSFDQFLDQHPDLDRQLRANPSLVNDSQFLQQHPELQAYLRDHQNVRAQLTENPTDFMNREHRYDARETRQQQGQTQNPDMDRDQDRNNDRDNRAGNQNPDVTRGEVARFDNFLDEHPDIHRQLSANPSLISSPQYLQQHPELQEWLNHHQNVKAELTENLNYFMRREGRYDAMETQRQNQGATQTTPDQTTRPYTQNQSTQGQTRPGNPNPDLTRGEIASFDQFLDDHQDINKQLEKNPQLVDDAGYVKKHKALATYLNEHPAVREELTENPAYFMKRENRFELSERDRDMDRSANNNQPNDIRTDRDRDRSRDVDTATSKKVNEKELKEADKFLSKHKSIDKDLRKNPSLCNNPEYLEKHKDFDSFLKKNPEVHEAMRRDPDQFMHERVRTEHMNHKSKEPPAKSKAQQREETRPSALH